MNYLLAAECNLTWEWVVLILGIALIIASGICICICAKIRKDSAIKEKQLDCDQHRHSLLDAFFYKKSLTVKINDSEYDVKIYKKSPDIDFQGKNKKD